MNTKDHWNDRYATRADSELSWTQTDPGLSLSWIEQHTTGDDRIVDIGAGRSILISMLLVRGYTKLTHLELSNIASDEMQQRLGANAKKVQWIVSSVLDWQPQAHYSLWHDRAVFHFLTSASDRAAYVSVLEQGTAEGSLAIMATFHTTGPEKCSGLPICQYEPETLTDEVNRHSTAHWELVASALHGHTTPGGSIQNFQYALLRRGALK